MANNQVEGNIPENKNLSLSEGLKNLIQEANSLAETAEQKIKEAYDYAIDVDKLEPREAAKVLKDNLKYSPQWINKFLPQEAKHLEKIRELKSAKVLSQNIQETPKEVENIIIPPIEENIIDITVEPENENEIVDLRKDTVLAETNKLKQENQNLRRQIEELSLISLDNKKEQEWKERYESLLESNKKVVMELTILKNKSKGGQQEEYENPFKAVYAYQVGNREIPFEFTIDYKTKKILGSERVS